MDEVIHRKNTPDGPRYRLWSTGSGSYITDEMTREQCATEIRARAAAFAVLEADREMSKRFERCDTRGTSSMIASNRDMSAWETERCAACDGFHHEFVRGGFARCRECGEPLEDVVHGSCSLYEKEEPATAS